MKTFMTFCVAVGFALGLFCGGETANGPLRVRIEHARVSPGGIVRCSWTLHNTGSAPLYVYASFLDGVSNDMVEDNSTGGLLLRTTWIDVIQSDPIYYFPPARFIEIRPGGTLTGELKGHMVAHRKKALTAQMVIGYGASIDQVQKEIAQSLQKGVEFQGNPIVRWQTLAYSPAIALHY